MVCYLFAVGACVAIALARCISDTGPASALDVAPNATVSSTACRSHHRCISILTPLPLYGYTNWKKNYQPSWRGGANSRERSQLLRDQK